MARFNKLENLMFGADKSSDFVIRTAFELTDLFILLDCQYKKDNSDYIYFDYLYRHNHGGKTFENIAINILCTSPSTLEKRRKKFRFIFNGYLIKIQEKLVDNEAAVTEII